MLRSAPHGWGHPVTSELRKRRSPNFQGAFERSAQPDFDVPDMDDMFADAEEPETPVVEVGDITGTSGGAGPRLNLPLGGGAAVAESPLSKKDDLFGATPHGGSAGSLFASTPQAGGLLSSGATPFPTGGDDLAATPLHGGRPGGAAAPSVAGSALRGSASVMGNLGATSVAGAASRSVLGLTGGTPATQWTPGGTMLGTGTARLDASVRPENILGKTPVGFGATPFDMNASTPFLGINGGAATPVGGGPGATPISFGAGPPKPILRMAAPSFAPKNKRIIGFPLCCISCASARTFVVLEVWYDLFPRPLEVICL